jgi:hypothetical protein
MRPACQEDAGQTAALEILGADLGEIAGTFLGEGNWRPQRKALIACWETAKWEKRTKEEEMSASKDSTDVTIKDAFTVPAPPS